MSIAASRISEFSKGDYIELVHVNGTRFMGAIESINSRELVMQSGPSGFKTTIKFRDIDSCSLANRDSSSLQSESIASRFEDSEVHGRITEINSEGIGGWITCDNGDKIGFFISDCDQEVRECLATNHRNLGTFIRVSFVEDIRRTRYGDYKRVAKLITLDDDFEVTIKDEGDGKELEFTDRNGEINGEIRLYNNVTEFGMIDSADGAEYQFRRRNGDAPFRNMLDFYPYDEIIGVQVAFLPKERKNAEGEIKPIADDIRLIDPAIINRAKQLAMEITDESAWEPPTADEVLYGHINYYDLARRRCIIGGDDSRTYTLYYSNREKVLKNFILGNTPDEITGTRVAFISISKSEEDMRERGSASKLRILTRDEDPLTPYAENALTIMVDTGDKSTQEQLLTIADKLYGSGKRFHRESAILYRRLLDSGYISTTVLKRLVSLYSEFGQLRETIDLLKGKETWFESREKYLELLLEVYRRQEKPAEALEIEIELLECVRKPAKRLNLTFSVAQSLFTVGRYEDSLKYCSDWITYKNGPNEAVFQRQRASLSLTEKAVCILAANCISLLGHNPRPSIAPLLEEYEEARDILTGPIATPDFHFEEGLRRNLTAVSEALIQTADLQEAGVDIRRFDSAGLYRGSTEDAKNDARRLTANVSSQRPHLRYRTCFAAAKLLMGALESRGEDDLECESLLYSNLASALVSRADTYISDESIDICIARFMYLEALRYADYNEQNCVDATVRCAISTFADRYEIPISMNGDSNTPISYVSKELDRTEEYSNADILNVLMRVYRNSLPEIRKRALERLCGEICKSNKAMEIGRFISQKAPSNSKHIPSTQQELSQLVQDYYGQVFISQERLWIKSVRQLSKADISPMGFKESIDIFAGGSSFEEMVDHCERDRFSSIGKMMTGISEYYELSSFRNKEAKLKDIIQQTGAFIESVSSGPTEYSFEYLLPIVRRWNSAFTNMLDELYATSQPQLHCTAVQSQVSLNEDNLVRVQLDITNEVEAQTADSVNVKIRESNDYIVESAPDRRSYIYGGEGETVAVTLRLEDSSLKAIALAIDIECDSLADSSHVNHQIFEDSVTIIIGRDEFFKLDNPYAQYVKSGVVTDEKMVFGRSQFITEVIESVRGTNGTPLRRKTIALYGQKRTGKSTVLYHLSRRLSRESPHTVVIYLGDISKWAKQSFEKKLYREFFKRLSKELTSRHPILYEALIERGVSVPNFRDIVDDAQGRDAFGDFMDEFNELVEEEIEFSDYNVALLLDEFTNIYMYLCRGQIDRDFMQYWKAIINDYGLVGIVVGQDYMPDFVSNYPNPFGAIDSKLVTYLTEAEARRMITAPKSSPESNHAVFNGPSGERAIKRIIELTACSAFFLMIFMDRLIRYLNRCERSYVTDADVKAILQDDLLSGNGSLGKDEFESLYYDDSDITDPSRPRHNMMVLWLLARKYKSLGRCKLSDITSCVELSLEGITEERVSRLLNRLVNRGVLTLDSAGNCTIRVGLFQEWLCKNCSLEVVEGIKDVQA